MQHKSIYFPIRQSGYVGKCMNYFNSLNCPETSQRMSERGGRGQAVLSVCSRDRNYSCSFNCPEIGERGCRGGAHGVKQWLLLARCSESAAGGDRGHGSRAAEQRPWAAPCPGRACPPLRPPPASPRPSQTPRVTHP